MNKKLLKATLSVSLVLATLAGATTVYAKSKMNDLNLTETQMEQLKEYRHTQKSSQQEADKAALSEFLTDEQVEAVMNEKGDKHSKKGKMKNAKHGGMNNILSHAEDLGLSENQVIQIETIIEANKPEKVEGTERPSRSEMKAQHEVVKAQVEAVLTDVQIEKMQEMRSEQEEKRGGKGSE